MPTATQTGAADRIRADRETWRAFVAAVGEDRFEVPGPMGEWSFRDVAGHLLRWRERTIARFEAAARGEPEPPRPWPADLDDDDSINAWIREQDADRSTRDLIDGYDASFERLAAAIEALPPDVVDDPNAFPWTEGQAVAEIDFGSHLHDEHDPTIRAWLEANPRR